MPARLNITDEERRERRRAQWRAVYYKDAAYRERKKAAHRKYQASEKGKATKRAYYKSVVADPISLEKVYKQKRSYMAKKRADPEWRNIQNQKVLEYFKTDKGRAARLKAERRRYQNISVQRRLGIYLRKRIYKALKVQMGDKCGSLYELIGIDINGLKDHLETTFSDGMSWDNYGSWHVDHKIPCALFDLTDEGQQRACFHFSNLQALWALDNIRKGARLETGS